ncbi:hypothetical protein CU009_2465 [Enterococcus faecium]|nr:hypothetical protein [Enterococcus faecium]
MLPSSPFQNHFSSQFSHPKLKNLQINYMIIGYILPSIFLSDMQKFTLF